MLIKKDVLMPLAFEKNVNKVIDALNLSLFNKYFEINSNQEIVNSRADYRKIHGSMFVDQDYLNGGFSLIEKGVLDDINYIKKLFRTKIKYS